MFAVKTFSNILLSQNKFQFAKNEKKSEFIVRWKIRKLGERSKTWTINNILRAGNLRISDKACRKIHEKSNKFNKNEKF